LQPFLCAAILGRRWDWLFIPMTFLVLTTFVMREPLLILARQKWSWSEAKPESAAVSRCLHWQLPLCALLTAVCLVYLPATPFVMIAAAGIT
jgi:hypothetical protein